MKGIFIRERKGVWEGWAREKRPIRPWLCGERQGKFFFFFNIIYFYLLIGLRLEETEGEIN